jgi:hypothetical protein
MITLYLLRRKKLEDRTLGIMHVIGADKPCALATLELPWVANERNISCIPAGAYDVQARTTKRFGRHLQVLAVPQRSGILIHAGNFPSQIRGCILVGLSHADIDGDGKDDVARSRVALDSLCALVTGPAKLIVVGAP